MNRIALMVLRNILKVPAAYSKLSRYAKILKTIRKQKCTVISSTFCKRPSKVAT